MSTGLWILVPLKLLMLGIWRESFRLIPRRYELGFLLAGSAYFGVIVFVNIGVLGTKWGVVMSKANRSLGAYVDGLPCSEIVGVVEHPDAFEHRDLKDCPGYGLPVYLEKFNDHLRTSGT